MFFTKEDFELFQKYGGKRASEYPEAHNLLRKVYNKLGEIAEEMKKYGFYSNIIRNPQNQGQKFETYHWAQLCPPYANDANGKIFFVIDLTEDGFGIHIDCNKKKNLTPNEETSKLQAWEKISVDNVCKIEKQEIIYKVIDYCERHRI